MSRKTGLTPEVHGLIVGYVRAGTPVAHAAHAARISPETVKGWLKRGDKEGCKEPFRSFALDVRQAQSEVVVRNVTTINSVAAGRQARTVKTDKGETITIQGADPDWRAAAWMLERQYPKLFAQRVAVLVDAEIDKFLDLLEQRLPAEVWEVVMQIAQEADSAGGGDG